MIATVGAATSISHAMVHRRVLSNGDDDDGDDGDDLEDLWNNRVLSPGAPTRASAADDSAEDDGSDAEDASNFFQGRPNSRPADLHENDDSFFDNTVV